jgi:hypothetical protein
MTKRKAMPKKYTVVPAHRVDNTVYFLGIAFLFVINFAFIDDKEESDA